MNFLMKITYDGSNFQGWQRLPKKRTVQGVIEDGLSKMLGEFITIDGAGRTDAGVHALGQMASFQTQCNITAQRLAYALNHFLPSDIRIIEVHQVSGAVHARYNAVGKRYGYKLYVSDAGIESPFRARYEAFNKYALDEVNIRMAMCHFIGTHDFRAYMASGSKTENTIRTIQRFELIRTNDDWYFQIEGDGFLYHMVRIIMGTLLDVGEGKIAPEQVPEIILSGDRNRAKRTAPASGLYLEAVYYDDFSHTLV